MPFWLFIGLKRSAAYTPEPGWGRFHMRVVGATRARLRCFLGRTRRIDWVGLVDHQG